MVAEKKVHRRGHRLNFFSAPLLGSGEMVAKKNIFGVKKEAQKGGDTIRLPSAKSGFEWFNDA